MMNPVSTTRDIKRKKNTVQVPYIKLALFLCACCAIHPIVAIFLLHGADEEYSPNDIHQDSYERRKLRSPRLDADRQKLHVVVPGMGDLKRLPILKKSLEGLKKSVHASGDWEFSCEVLIWKNEIFSSVSQALGTSCRVHYSQGLWTNHMLSAKLSEGFSHVAILMDDMDVSSMDVPDFMSTMRLSDYDVASAAIPGWHYPALHPRQACDSHQTDFVDILFAVFTAAAWDCWIRNIDLQANQYGWGYDVTFADNCQMKVGVIDSFEGLHVSNNKSISPCTTGGECTRSYNTSIASEQMHQWIASSRKLQSQEQAQEYWNYVAFERPKSFPTCTKYASQVVSLSSPPESILFRIADPEYFRTVEHRGGWRVVIESLEELNVLEIGNSRFDTAKGLEEGFQASSLQQAAHSLQQQKAQEEVLLVDVNERWFLWEEFGKITTPWIGIFHFPVSVPKHVRDLPDHLEPTVLSNDFMDSLPYCLGIVVLTEEKAARQVEVLISNVTKTHVNVCTAYHPIATGQVTPYDVKQDLGKQLAPSAGVLLLGQQFRRFSTIHRLQTQRRKMWLPGRKDKKSESFQWIEERLEDELKVGGWAKDDSVEIVYVDSFTEYDQLVKQSLVIVDLWTATANNAVLEAISLNAPFFIRRLAATEHYLGRDYPLFFSSFEELQDMLDDKNAILGDRFRRAHEYLRYMDKSRLSVESFGQDLQRCASEGIKSKNGELFSLSTKEKMGKLLPTRATLDGDRESALRTETFPAIVKVPTLERPFVFFDIVLVSRLSAILPVADHTDYFSPNVTVLLVF